jgi:hypothetical protein
MYNYFKIPVTGEVICFLIAIFCLSKNTNLLWRGIILYLLVTCITEFFGIYLKSHHQANQWPYNILLIFQMVFSSLLFGEMFNKYIKSKPIIISGLALLLGLYLFELFDHDFFRFYELSYNTMSVLFIFYCLYYFYLLLKDNKYINLKYSADFWFVAGSLLFYFGGTAINLFRGKLSIIVGSQNHYLTYYLYIVLAVLLYGCWSYSFICRKWLTKKSEIL